MTAAPKDPWTGFKDSLRNGFALGAPASSKELEAFGRALHSGLDQGGEFEKCRSFVREANDRIIAKSVGVLQFNAVLLAVVVLMIDQFGSGNYAVLACGVLALTSSMFLLFNMHLFTSRDAATYANTALHYRQQLVLFQRRARWHTFGLSLSLLSLVFVALAPFSLTASGGLPAAEQEHSSRLERLRDVTANPTAPSQGDTPSTSGGEQTTTQTTAPDASSQQPGASTATATPEIAP